MGDPRETTGIIFGLDQTALHDGPGVRMNVYLKGCPLRCVWCHSPESQRFEPEVVWYETRCTACGRCVQACRVGVRTLGLMSAEDRQRCTLCGDCVAVCSSGALEIIGRTVTAGEIVDEAARLAPFFGRTGGGVTLTGGEPTAQPEFAYAVASLCREAGIHVAMETCGVARAEVFERLVDVVDLFLFDIKHADCVEHERVTGTGNEGILRNLACVVASDADVLVRVPLIPTVNDDAETVRAMARLAVERGVERITLLPYNPATPGKYSWVRRELELGDVHRQSPEYLARLAEICRVEGLTVEPA